MWRRNREYQTTNHEALSEKNNEEWGYEEVYGWNRGELGEEIVWRSDMI